MNGASQGSPNAPNLSSSSQSAGGFVAVNSRPHGEQNGASSSTRHELMSKFHTVSERRTSSQPANGSMDARRLSMGPHNDSHPATPVSNASRPPKPAELAPPNIVQQRPPHLSESELHHVMNSPVPIPSTPSSLLPAASQRASQPQDKDDGGPFKAEMVHRMEALAKGERILPPCDRCRRLHMDCLKNLTACMGCTKKHAKCSWKEVRENELRGNFSHPPPSMNSRMRSESEELDNANGNGNGNGNAERASTGSPAAVLSPPRHGMTPAAQQGMPQEPRLPSNRNSPPNIEREVTRGVEAQLQEAAKSGLAHANARLGPHEGGKGPEYQTMVA